MTDPRESPQPGLRAHLPRLALLALCLALTWAALAELADWRGNRDRLIALLESTGVADRDPQAAALVGRERTPHHARLMTASALLYDVFERLPDPAAPGAAATPIVQPQRIDQLEAARALARQVLREQPNSWQAAMLLGAASYLEWSLRDDPRLFTAYQAWHDPLLAALERAPGQVEPRRFLIAAYLETWPVLSPERKDFARALMRRTFAEDPPTFERLAPYWQQAAEDQDDLFSVVPDRPEAWQWLESTYVSTGDWDGFLVVHRRRLDALENHLRRELREAGERLRLGDYQRARTICLALIARAPRDGRFAPLASEALELYPPGLHGLSSTAALRAWLDWALELETYGVRPLTPRAIAHLIDAVGNLEPYDGARAALAAGDLYQMGRFERLTEVRTTAPWAPFLIAKARWLLERRELGQAAQTLDQVAPAHRSQPAYWLTRWRIARARGDLPALSEAERALAEHWAREWPPEAWSWDNRRAELEMLPAAAARGVAIELGRVPAGGTVVEVAWDGTAVAFEPVYPGETLELALEVTTRLHRLGFRSLAHGGVVPGRVRLLPDGPAPRAP